MKKLSIRRQTAAAALFVALLTAAPAQGGLLSILKGEKAITPVQKFQKVAFIGHAEVKQVNGGAERLSGIDQWETLRAGAQLITGDLIRTLEGGSVVLKMKDSGSLVRVTSMTALRLVPLEPTWDKGMLTGQREEHGFAVRAVRGNVSYHDEAGNWKRVSVDSVLPIGAQIRTAKNAEAVFLYAPTALVLKISSEAEIMLDPLAKPIAGKLSSNSPNARRTDGITTAALSK